MYLASVDKMNSATDTVFPSYLVKFVSDKIKCHTLPELSTVTDP